MINTVLRLLLIVTMVVVANSRAYAQQRPVDLDDIPDRGNNRRVDAQGRAIRKNKDTTLQHRTGFEDSVTVYFRYFDSTRTHTPDTSLNDFSKRFVLPYHYYHLGNIGTAARSYIFNPFRKAGFDPGFHAYDAYRFTIKDTRFYQTTRPFTELSYVLGSKAEQTIGILHTQNRNQNLNFAFQYRLINSPGIFQNQNTNHNNIRFNIGFQSPNKRYHLYVIFINNKLKSSENGGLQRPDRLDSLSLRDPIELPSRLGGSTQPSRNPFRAFITTGSTYTENILLLRNQYDFGQKDSLVVDTNVYRLFYPRFRLQHTFTFSNNTYNFTDADAYDSIYTRYFNYSLNKAEDTTFSFVDKWRNITNEFSIISFPVKNNPNQFVRLTAGIELLKGQLDTNKLVVNYSNVYAGAEYRNRTRNQKWELGLEGKLYTTGGYSGDYSLFLSLSRTIGKKIGYIVIGGENINRTPSFVFDSRSAFPLKSQTGFGKENITRLFAELNITSLNLKLFGNYYLISNYSYFDSFYHATQDATILNVLHIGAEQRLRLMKNVYLHIDAHLQQKTANAPVNVPLLFARGRLAWEGKALKNLNWATGFELRYHTPFKADNYSPLTGQFFYQDHFTLRNRPHVNFFLHFRITRFTGYLRAENLNTLINRKYNFRAEHYPDRNLWIRVGIFWNFVN